MTSSRSGDRSHFSAVACALVGFCVFHFFGNATRGYIDTTSVFWWWAVQWFNPGSEAEHGPILLVLAIGVFWRNWKRGGDRVPHASHWGNAPAVAALFGAVLLHLLGYLVQQTRVSIVALLLYGWAVAQLAGGKRAGDAIRFPLVLLLFAIPVEFLDSLGFHLRLGVIAAAERLASLMGIAVVRSGTQLFAPDGAYQYDVAAACSGVRSLMALLALSLLIGYLQLRSNVARGALIVLALPLTFVGNVIRILGVVVAGALLGERAGEWVHEWAGWVVFVVVLGGVQLAAWRMAQRERPPPIDPPAPVDPWASVTESWPRRIALITSVVVVAGAVAILTRKLDTWTAPARSGLLVRDTGEPTDLPAFIGADWIGRSAELTAAEREVLPADTGYARRTYVALRNAREQVLLFVVLSGRDRTSIHRPELCLGGQGWTIKRRTEQRLRHPGGGQIPAAVLELEREQVGRDGRLEIVPSVFMYWFVGHDAVVASTPARMWRSAWNRLRLRPDRWGYVVAQTPLLPQESTASAVARVQEVLDGTLEAFQPGGDTKL